MDRYSAPLITAVLGAAILLMGCTAPAAIQAVDRPGTAEDKMPDGITFEGTDIKTDSVRLLAAKDG